MSDKAKRRLITCLYILTIAAAIASVLIGVKILVQISHNQASNHNDTQTALTAEIQNSNLNQQIIICMLQVPLAQRTTDLAKQCRSDAVAADALTSTPATAQSSSSPQTATTVAPATTSASTPSAQATVPTPATTITTPKVPLNCTIDLLGIHLGC